MVPTANYNSFFHLAYSLLMARHPCIVNLIFWTLFTIDFILKALKD